MPLIFIFDGKLIFIADDESMKATIKGFLNSIPTELLCPEAIPRYDTLRRDSIVPLPSIFQKMDLMYLDDAAWPKEPVFNENEWGWGSCSYFSCLLTPIEKIIILSRNYITKIIEQYQRIQITRKSFMKLKTFSNLRRGYKY